MKFIRSLKNISYIEMCVVLIVVLAAGHTFKMWEKDRIIQGLCNELQVAQSQPVAGPAKIAKKRIVASEQTTQKITKKRVAGQK